MANWMKKTSGFGQKWLMAKNGQFPSFSQSILYINMYTYKYDLHTGKTASVEDQNPPTFMYVA